MTGYDEIARQGFDERLHMIDKGAITKRVPLRMNLIYGELEEVPTRQERRKS